MLTSKKHHAKTRGAPYCGEARAAKLALSGITGASGAAVWTVKCFCLHSFYFISLAIDGGLEK
jgi:hypothetical protein